MTYNAYKGVRHVASAYARCGTRRPCPTALAGDAGRRGNSAGPGENGGVGGRADNWAGRRDLDEAVGVPVDGDAVAARRDGVVELVEEEAGDGELRRHAVRDEDAAAARARSAERWRRRGRQRAGAAAGTTRPRRAHAAECELPGSATNEGAAARHASARRTTIATHTPGCSAAAVVAPARARGGRAAAPVDGLAAVDEAAVHGLVHLVHRLVPTLHPLLQRLGDDPRQVVVEEGPPVVAEPVEHAGSHLVHVPRDLRARLEP
jgi:hypothetical protein